MEHVDGESLSELLKRKPTLTEAEIREHVLPVAAGLAEVHAAGLLHRDIKPGNIVIRADGTPVLIDFGSGPARDERKIPEPDRCDHARASAARTVLFRFGRSATDDRHLRPRCRPVPLRDRRCSPDATDRALEDRLTSAAETADGAYGRTADRHRRDAAHAPRRTAPATSPRLSN